MYQQINWNVMQIENVYFFSIRDKYFAYDIYTTHCVEIDDIALTILPELLAGAGNELGEKYAHLYLKTSLLRCIKECKELIESGILGAKISPCRHNIQSNIATLCLHIAHDCNLRCEYCYADAGSFGGNRMLMSSEVMMKAVDFAFSNSGDTKELSIGFFGGEPLLNFKLICEAVRYSKECAEKFDKKVDFRLTTNATLLTPNVMDFINKENFSLLFSIDGPKNIHDRMRKFKSGMGSHYNVLKNIKKYSHKYSANFTVRGTYTRTTPNFSEQVLFLNEQGFKKISVEPAQLDAIHPHSISNNSEILRIKCEYDKMANIYLDRFNSDAPISFFHFDHCLGKLLQPWPYFSECGAGGGFIAITPDGRIFPCFETVVEKDNCIGHIDFGFDQEKRNIFQRMNVDKRKGCKECWIRYFCGGGCNAFNIRYNHNIHIPYKPHCELTKYRFKLACWILSEIIGKGEKAINKLKKHLQVE